MNLFGTETEGNQPIDYIDRYVDTNLHQQYNYLIFNQELWEFLFKRYGGNPIKRFYTRSTSAYYTSVEAKLQPLTVQFINCKELLQGTLNDSMFKTWWTQVGKNANLKDVKKRVTDHINAAGMQVTLDDTRLWLYTTTGDKDT